MTVNIELFRGKRLADGAFPVMIRICSGRLLRRIGTGVSARPRLWNAARRRVSARDPLHADKNAAIYASYARVLDNPVSFLPKPAPKATGDFILLIRDKMAECRRVNTARSYGQLLAFMQRHFGDSIPMAKVDDAFVIRFSELLAAEKAATDTMRRKLEGLFAAICSYGRARGLTDFHPDLHAPKGGRAMHSRDLLPEEIKEMLTECRRRILADPALLGMEARGAAIFALSFAFQGLAPVDLAALRVGDVSCDGNAVEINLRRRKTDRPVHIIAYRPALDIILNPLMQGKEPDDFLIDCFDRNVDRSERQQVWRLSNYFHALTEHLPHPEGRRVTFYYARHAYCNALEEADVPRHIIRKLVGHAPGVLERSYLRPPSRSELLQLSRAILTTAGFYETDTSTPKN